MSATTFLTGCTHMIGLVHGGAERPAESEFGLGPRVSKAGRYTAELEFLITDAPELQRAYKVPSLRGVADRAPYMHAGQFATSPHVEWKRRGSARSTAGTAFNGGDTVMNPNYPYLALPVVQTGHSVIALPGVVFVSIGRPWIRMLSPVWG